MKPALGQPLQFLWRDRVLSVPRAEVGPAASDLRIYLLASNRTTSMKRRRVIDRRRRYRLECSSRAAPTQAGKMSRSRGWRFTVFRPRATLREQGLVCLRLAQWGICVVYGNALRLGLGEIRQCTPRLRSSPRASSKIGSALGQCCHARRHANNRTGAMRDTVLVPGVPGDLAMFSRFFCSYCLIEVALCWM